MRIAVYTDYAYRQDEGRIYGERAFVLFVARLAGSMDQMTIVGRLNPEPGRSHYPLPPGISFVGLPHYASLTRPWEAAFSMVRSLGRFRRVLDEVDMVWLLGPYLHSLAFVALAAAKGKPIVLGVRQDLPQYTRSRHPGRRWLHWAADTLEASWRLLSRRFPIVVVGPQLAEHYSHAIDVLPAVVSLVPAADIVSEEEAGTRDWNGERRIVSVGRLDTEKNPLLLADILAELHRTDPRWRLVVCGDGPLAEPLRERLRALGVEHAAELLGYVPIEDGLHDVYRSAHALLHVSWTEGLPQVIFEAFAAGLPVVATAVGGVPAAVGDAALLVPPGDGPAAAAELQRLADDPELRTQLVSAGLAQVRAHTLEAESARVAEFIEAAAQARRARTRRAA